LTAIDPMPRVPTSPASAADVEAWTEKVAWPTKFAVGVNLSLAAPWATVMDEFEGTAVVPSLRNRLSPVTPETLKLAALVVAEPGLMPSPEVVWVLAVGSPG